RSGPPHCCLFTVMPGAAEGRGRASTASFVHCNTGTPAGACVTNEYSCRRLYFPSLCGQDNRIWVLRPLCAVIPAEAGIQGRVTGFGALDSRLRGNDRGEKGNSLAKCDCPAPAGRQPRADRG